MTRFKRRTYTASGFFRDIITVIIHPVLALGVLWGFSLPPRFRERLYLAVIAVNGCRYCTYLHTRSALQAGLSREDVNFLLSGVAGNVPLEEAKALLYAQHWADKLGRPEAQAREALIAAYGATQARAIEMALVLIQIGSLSGNSFDYFLYRLTCGRLGLTLRDES